MRNRGPQPPRPVGDNSSTGRRFPAQQQPAAGRASPQLFQRLFSIIAPLTVLGLLAGSVVLYRSRGRLGEEMFSTIGTKDTRHYDVIVVGGGLAGLSASIEAARGGARVLIVDKERQLGGNSAKASSGINAVGSEAQKRHPVAHKDNKDIFYSDTMKSGDWQSGPELVDVLTSQSSTAIKFLESFGLELDRVTQCGGHSFPRTHRTTPKAGQRVANIGWEIISKLKAAVEAHEEIETLTQASARRLVTEELRDGRPARVGGVEVDIESEDGSKVVRTLLAHSVVLASGGYAADRHGILKRHAPQDANLPTTNGGFAVGDGLHLGEEVGAEAINLDKVQVHPTGFINPKDRAAQTKILAAEALRGEGGILLSPQGRRFVNELDRRDRVTEAIFRQSSKREDAFAFLVVNDEVRERFGPGIMFYIKFGLFTEYQSLAAFSAQRDIPLANLERSITDYNAAAAAGRDEFGKTLFPVAFNADSPIWVAEITPVIHYTMGGLKMSKESEILRADNSTIPGLYGAGEVTGGVHGANRLAGNSLLECVVFGRIAGRNAAKNALSAAGTGQE